MSAELVVEVRDLGGSGGSKAATKAASRALSEDPGGDAVRQTRFLGRAEVPLASTLTITNGECLFLGIIVLLRSPQGCTFLQPPLHSGSARRCHLKIFYICHIQPARRPLGTP